MHLPPHPAYPAYRHWKSRPIYGNMTCIHTQKQEKDTKSTQVGPPTAAAREASQARLCPGSRSKALASLEWAELSVRPSISTFCIIGHATWISASDRSRSRKVAEDHARFTSCRGPHDIAGEPQSAPSSPQQVHAFECSLSMPRGPHVPNHIPTALCSSLSIDIIILHQPTSLCQFL